MKEESTDLALAELLESWFDRKEAGEDPDLDELCSDHPELRGRMEKLVRRESDLCRVLHSIGEESSATPPIPAQRIGDFELHGLLGQGGSAAVYRAEQASLGREVALKILDPVLARDDARRARFFREAELTAALAHSNIVPIHAIGEDEGFCYIAMQLFSGPGLEALPEPLSPRRAAEIGIPVARALDEAHAAGVVHRDVKPANVILDGETPYLLDFGLAQADGVERLTRTGSVAGTLPYMSPEQLSHRTLALDARTDVYSLGATLYEAVTGAPPFEDDDPTILMRSILGRDPKTLGVAGVDRDFETIVLRALAKEPTRRFQTAGELADDLERFLERRPIASRRAGVVTRAVLLARRHSRISASAAAALLVVLGLVAVVIWQELGAEQTFARLADEARGNFAALRLETAVELLDGLEQRWPDDPRVAELRELEHAAFALVDLLDFVQGRTAVLSKRRVRTALQEAKSKGAERVDRRLARMGYAAGHHFLGEREAALAELEQIEAEFGLDRGVVALRAVAQGEDPWAACEAAPEVRADGFAHVFAAMAFRYAQCAPEMVESELRWAGFEDMGNGRAIYALGVLYEDLDRREAAWLAFDSLAKDRPVRPTILRSLAYQEAALGRFDRAELYLERARGAREIRHPDLQAAAEIRLAKQRGDRETARTLLKSALAKWPDDAILRVIEGEMAVNSGHVEYGRAQLVRAAAEIQWRPLVTQIEIEIALATYVLELPDEHDVMAVDLTEDQKALAADLLQHVRELADEVENELALSRARLLESRILRLTGDFGGSWKALEAARSIDELNVSAELRFATVVLARAKNLEAGNRRTDLMDSGVIGDVEDQFLDALAATQRVVDGRRSAGPVASADKELAYFVQAALAEKVHDFERAEHAARKAVDLMESRAVADEDENYQEALEILDRCASEDARLRQPPRSTSSTLKGPAVESSNSAAAASPARATPSASASRSHASNIAPIAYSAPLPKA